MNDLAQAAGGTRLATGIPGLDDVLQGGLQRASVVIVQGSPGAGKTVLANQFAYHQAAHGGHVLYMTLLSESHGRLLANIGTMEFFDPTAVATRVRYVSGFDTLEREGIKGVLRLLATEARSLQADAIVLDGLFVLEENAESTREFRKFVNAMALQAEAMGCTILLLTNSKVGDCSPEYTMVDSWIELSRTQHEYRSARWLQVHKQRGSGFNSGLHTVRIGDAGLRVLPRIESLHLPAPPAELPQAPRTSTGVPRVDEMLGGGVRAGSSVLLAGPSGIGKTSFGLQMLSAAGADERTLVFTFYETPDRVMAKAESLQLPFADRVRGGTAIIQWNAPTEMSIDCLGHQLLDTVRRERVTRVLLDGVEGFRQASIFRERLSRFLTALANSLRMEGCTSIFTMELPKVFGDPADFHLDSLSAIAENLLLMRYTEIDGRLTRCLSVVKVRDAAVDPFTHRYEIRAGGIQLGERLTQLGSSAA